ncbi:probable UDP-N-acetylglucosamine--peptide N-acetylglucosaminyltransferase SPINDLY isoform X2 [Phalaenopsis equestris]|uniref:probable UDP-N-acetylglucosamine--peptide N-acetylglucosaminyltransferase SPINDLY isoform X2 n=1 Tax=Phalaenopsis equestris TaxID=78828 RepID=UPI0009E5327C|nr:probable UDP-N-acetylglucosamine--peptide N-acetylglucosaminyltransferase SPINDLY isoform X2 [Phalaenopsis equestris]
MQEEQTAAASGDQTLSKTPALDDPSLPLRPPKTVILADLNVDPPESDGEDCPFVPVSVSPARSSNDDTTEVKNTVINKDPDVIESEDPDQQCHGVSFSREEKVSILKAGLVHVARKMPKNAHAHFLLGLMYQRLGQPQKAVAAFEKSSEILQRDEEEIRRPDLLSLVLNHHAQCIIQVNIGDSSDKELEPSELDEILTRIKDSLHLDAKQAAVWNTLGLILLRTGRPQSAIAVFSCILVITPDFLDSLANLGIAYLQSGNLQLSAKCFQDLILKDQNHPAALINYAAFLLCKYGSIIAGPGANAGEGTYLHKVEAATVARDCLLAATKIDPKSGPLWINLANAYYLIHDYDNAKRCLEKAGKLEPNQMSVRYAIALHRIKYVERFQECNDQIAWAANEMASILKEGDPSMIDLPITWAGLALAHRVEHEITVTRESENKGLVEVEERALYSLKQAVEEDPNDVAQWHQFGLHNLRVLQFNTSVRFLKETVARCVECSYAWSNLGVALQLSDDPSLTEEVYKRALSLTTAQQAHAILSNLGNLFRQQKRFEHAKIMFAKSLEICPGYALAHNNLGLVYVAEGRWEDAVSCFEKALQSDPLLDAAKSNMVKVAVMCSTAGSSK